jgi:hypothetical protein
MVYRPEPRLAQHPVQKSSFKSFRKRNLTSNLFGWTSLATGSRPNLLQCKDFRVAARRRGRGMGQIT